MSFAREYVDEPHEAECMGCGEEEPICRKCNTSQGAGCIVYCDGSGENHLCESCKKSKKIKNKLLLGAKRNECG